MDNQTFPASRIAVLQGEPIGNSPPMPAMGPLQAIGTVSKAKVGGVDPETGEPVEVTMHILQLSTVQGINMYWLPDEVAMHIATQLVESVTGGLQLVTEMPPEILTNGGRTTPPGTIPKGLRPHL